MWWVVMNKYISGGRHDGREWPPEGAPFEVEDWEGEDLVYHGHAYRVASPVQAPPPPPPPAPAPEQEAPAVVEETSPPEPEEPADDAPAPAPADPKAAWVAYAVSQGASQAEAESLTKNQLQSAYGGRLLS
jgi:hypothetical protein